MKVWPIITLVGLIYGSTLADPKGVGRESNPHPHRSSLDAEVAADFAQPHRPVTMAFREVFAKLLNEETDWSAPESRQATAQAEADADDGQDPGKKLFWTTNHPDITGVPFPGWGDPNAEPDHPLVSPPACSTCRPELFFYTIIEDPAPPKEDENFAVEAQAHITMGNLPFGALKALDNMVIGEGGKVTVAPCETILVNGACPLPCKPNDPLCVDDPLSLPLPIVVDPISPVTPPVIIIGGGGGSGPVGAVGGVPETSTWLMGIIGFGFLSLFRRSVMSTASGLIPRPTKA
jgi:hypothetical protein